MPITIPTQAGQADITRVLVYPVAIKATGECAVVAPDEANFFTLYGVDTEGLLLAIHDYGTQHEAELAACVFGSLIKLQEKMV